MLVWVSVVHILNLEWLASVDSSLGSAEVEETCLWWLKSEDAKLHVCDSNHMIYGLIS